MFGLLSWFNHSLLLNHFVLRLSHISISQSDVITVKSSANAIIYIHTHTHAYHTYLYTTLSNIVLLWQFIWNLYPHSMFYIVLYCCLSITHCYVNYIFNIAYNSNSLLVDLQQKTQFHVSKKKIDRSNRLNKHRNLINLNQ